ncbi:uncharacterized protein LOC119440486 [Dermacentor silvarum]|uniref:uncharacterized protein LOC119440486 n=1 Tax=Dermacentor silvarum TaxID=543639 RepID=UPI00189C05A9|nr:uncharacterized protein LOC119440486 [Dermacentor silvarum]
MKEHCRVLCKQQWDELCNSLDGQLHNRQTWKLLKYLLDNTIIRPHRKDGTRHVTRQGSWLRSPISLISCVGKVMEHAFRNLVNAHLELTGADSHTVIGFRAHLLTQDAMLQLKYQSRNTKAILGLNLESAFDRVAHSAILAQISHLNVRERAYNYVKDFLSD